MTFQDWIQLLGPVAAGAALNPLGRQIADSTNGKISSRKMLKAELQEPQVDTDFFGYLLKAICKNRLLLYADEKASCNY